MIIASAFTLTMFRRLFMKIDGSLAALIKSAHKIPDQIPCRFEAIKLFRIQQAIRDVKPTKVWIYIRDLLIWQIEEFLYPTSILSVIYHIRADAFRFFGP